jgi:DNA-binding SARP family transcriptional activator
MPVLSLTLCGRVALEGEGVHGVPASLSAKALALLAYLALEPGAHSRDELAALLWGDSPDDKAKASLRQALVHLREVVPDSLRVDRSSVELAGPLACDVTTFYRLAKDSPRAAADVPVTRFLDGLHLRHCPAFDEWADRTRASLIRRSTEVLSAATRDALATRQWNDAVRLAERWTVVAPGAAAAAAALMEAHFMAGAHTAAIGAYERYRTYLADETGRSPEPPLVQLLERIQSSSTGREPVPHQATEEWYAAAPSFDGSLVGRSREWDTLTRIWSKVVRGRSRVLIIEGNVGVGKTRLAADFFRWVTAEGGTVLRGRAHDARRGVPLGAVIEALRSGLDAPGLAGTDPQWLAEVARLVPELRARFPALGEVAPTIVADRGRLVEAVTQVVSALGEEAPVAVLIDDLHWCDADSCAVLHAVIRALENTPVLWCLTFSPGSIERDAPVSRLARALRASPHTTRVELRPLSEDEVWELMQGLGRVRATDDAHRLATRIHELTAGYPFYVIELLKTLFAQGWLTVDPESGEWILEVQGQDESLATVPLPSVHEAIAERIHCLPDELGAMLITLAVSAHGCRADVLSYVHGISRLRAAMVGDALVERHLAVEEDGEFRCAHPAIARVVTDSLGTSRRREVNRALAVAVETAATEAGTVPEPGEVARYAEQGGERAMAFRYAMLAAAAADARGAPEEALRWLDFASAAVTTAADADAVNAATARLLVVRQPSAISYQLSAKRDSSGYLSTTEARPAGVRLADS